MDIGRYTHQIGGAHQRDPLLLLHPTSAAAAAAGALSVTSRLRSLLLLGFPIVSKCVSLRRVCSRVLLCPHHLSVSAGFDHVLLLEASNEICRVGCEQEYLGLLSSCVN